MTTSAEWRGTRCYVAWGSELERAFVSAMLHAVAALLNAANEDVSYQYSEDEVKAIVQEAYATAAFEELKYLLEGANEAGCPLNNCR
jgi:hypothetical protein